MVQAASVVVVAVVVFVAQGRKRSRWRRRRGRGGRRRKKNEAWSIIPSDRLEGQGQGMKINELRTIQSI